MTTPYSLVIGRRADGVLYPLKMGRVRGIPPLIRLWTLGRALGDRKLAARLKVAES